jgi:protein SCO1
MDVDPDRPPATPRPRRRWPLVAATLGAAIMAAHLVALIALAQGGDPALNADPVEPARDAPLTRGRDADGTSVSVPAPGRPAIVTFLFANCPDICPLAAQEIAQALDASGARPADIDVVAVSVDPEGDTPAAVRAFLARHRLTGRMRYIIGSAADLQPLWRAWLVAAQRGDARDSVHSARVVLVDREGRQAGSYAAGLPIDVADLAADIRTLTR